MIFFTEDESKFCARPSGTELKVKFYISVHSDSDWVENYTKVAHSLKEKINSIRIRIELELQTVS